MIVDYSINVWTCQWSSYRSLNITDPNRTRPNNVLSNKYSNLQRQKRSLRRVARKACLYKGNNYQVSPDCTLDHFLLLRFCWTSLRHLFSVLREPEMLLHCFEQWRKNLMGLSSCWRRLGEAGLMEVLLLCSRLVVWSQSKASEWKYRRSIEEATWET